MYEIRFYTILFCAPDWPRLVCRCLIRKLILLPLISPNKGCKIFKAETAIKILERMTPFLLDIPTFVPQIWEYHIPNMVIFRSGKLYSLWSPGKQHYQIKVNPGFLRYKVNISFLTEKLPYSQIGGTKGIHVSRKFYRVFLRQIRFDFCLSKISILC